ncbi:hypothetical protein TCE0_044f16478 [Talaromyces pinophilus]|uniref:Uncharacterized protein n=1 Tax=Talaromyces pinophilus TaxID=128442 RepID=A0A478EB57_TALPI|nr:hypothetical protein DPV78_011534 [Talaromyces pinophilus]PCG95987.1 Hypothetical protein PENO1_070730 [Penicillium occitanis (nom. inval.)]PCG96207.1 hypothetical protein PENOC_073930 [Penicillium occitanis (nom. inval.)]GAM42467.1 hypothetical protein TCE0_044f16478 [Talaromyces pinophilus]
MYTKASSTLLLALFALLLVSVNALPRILHVNVTPTSTEPLPSASFSMQASSQVPSEVADPTPETHATLHDIPNDPMAGFEDDSATAATSTTSSTTPSPSASATSLASSLSLLTSVTGWLSSLTGLMGLA